MVEIIASHTLALLFLMVSATSSLKSLSDRKNATRVFWLLRQMAASCHMGHVVTTIFFLFLLTALRLSLA